MVKSKVLKMRDQSINDISNEILEALRGITLTNDKSRVNCIKVMQKEIKTNPQIQPNILTRIISACFPLMCDLSAVVRDQATKFVFTYIDIYGTKGSKLARKYSDLLYTQLEMGLTHSWSTIRVETLQFIDKMLTKGINVLYNKEEQLLECLSKYSENALKNMSDFHMKDLTLNCMERVKLMFEKRKLEEFEANKIKTVETTFVNGQWCGVVFDNQTLKRSFVNEWIN